MNEKINRLKNNKNLDNIVFFGDGGVSTKSDISDFQGSNGVYNNNDKSVEYYLSTDYFRYDTEEFFRLYKANVNTLKVKINISNYYLADLEKMIN